LDIELGVELGGSAIAITGFGRPMGVAVGPDAWFYVCDMSLHTVFAVSPELDRFRWLSAADGWSPEKKTRTGTRAPAADATSGFFNGPHSIDFALDGGFCVTCYYEPGLHFFAADGAFRSTLRQLSTRLSLQGPATSMYGSDGALLVTEYRLGLVAVLDAGGKLATIIGDRADNGGLRLERPHMARRLADGTILVADTWNHRLVVADNHGEQVRWWGLELSGAGQPGWHAGPGRAAPGPMPGALNGPVSLDLRPDGGGILVADWGNHRLQQIPLPGDESVEVIDLGLKSPYDARYFDRSLLVADSHNHRVLIADRPGQATR
jgi:DNA-binding beta-propeller fold protein YncE